MKVFILIFISLKLLSHTDLRSQFPFKKRDNSQINILQVCCIAKLGIFHEINTAIFKEIVKFSLKILHFTDSSVS